jgi:hypothetical protein
VPSNLFGWVLRILVGGWLASHFALEPIQTYFMAILFSVPLIVIFTMLARSKFHAFVSTVLMLTFWAIITSNFDVPRAIKFNMEMLHEWWKRARTSKGDELLDFWSYCATPDYIVIHALVFILLLILLSAPPPKPSAAASSSLPLACSSLSA